MPLTLTMQFNLLMYSVIAGIITGFLFDIYRGIRGLNSIKIITVIEDIPFLDTYSSNYIYFFIVYQLCIFNSVCLYIHHYITFNILESYK